MSTNETLELQIDGIAQGGDGVARHEGMAIFVRGGLPGERVRATIRERRPSYAYADLAELLEASPDRVAPLVPASDHAAWQHIAYPAQLRFKETIVRDQLAKLARLHEPPLAPIVAAPLPWGYRSTARLHAAGGALGYHAAGSRQVVDLPSDPLLRPALNEALAGLREVVPPGLLSSVLLRGSAAYGYAVGVLEPAPAVDPADLEAPAAAWLARVPSLAAVAIAGQAEPEARLHDELGGVVFDLSAETFFQVNVDQAERLIALARAELGLRPGERLLDAYSGAGTFALPLAAGLAEVTAVEEHRAAVFDGRRSAELNAIDNVRFVRGAAERELPRLAGPFDAAVLDPPRRGCHPAVLDALAELAPPRIAYISCHPGILARDLGPLLDAGYGLELVQPVDLFPQTPHIETVVILRR